jgi:hypothetical protein
MTRFDRVGEDPIVGLPIAADRLIRLNPEIVFMTNDQLHHASGHDPQVCWYCVKLVTALPYQRPKKPSNINAAFRSQNPSPPREGFERYGFSMPNNQAISGTYSSVLKLQSQELWRQRG